MQTRQKAAFVRRKQKPILQVVSVYRLKSSMIYLEEQLRFLHALQAARNPFTEFLARALNLVDTYCFVMGLIALVMLISHKWGFRLFFLMTFAGIVNVSLKYFFQLPRPGVYDSSLPLVSLGGYGFPSGGAQSALIFGVLIIYAWHARTRWAWGSGIFYFILLSFSRLFLGVHFPIDVLGGWVSGAIILSAFFALVQPIEQLFAVSHPWRRGGLVILSAALIGVVPVYLRWFLEILFVMCLFLFGLSLKKAIGRR